MKMRTKVVFVLGCAFLAGACVILLVWPDSYPAKALGALGVSALAFGAYLQSTARTIYRFLAGELGPVEGKGDPFATVEGQPHAIDVWADSEVHRVTLPPGMDSGKVRAVKVTPGGRAVVEILP